MRSTSSVHARWSARLLFSLGILSLAAGGCGGVSANEPKTAVVSGKVSYKGQPVTEGIISFYDQATGNQAQGYLTAGGEYSLKTVGKGAVVGHYKVIVMPLTIIAGGMTIGADGKPTAPPQKDPDNIPKRYRAAGTTNLTATVGDSDNKIDFELKD